MAYGISVKEHTILGEKVFLKGMTAGENSIKVVSMLGKLAVEPELTVEVGKTLAFSCVCDKDGKPEFTSIEDAGESCSLGFVTALINPCLTASGLEDDAREVKKSSKRKKRGASSSGSRKS